MRKTLPLMIAIAALSVLFVAAGPAAAQSPADQCPTEEGDTVYVGCGANVDGTFVDGFAAAGVNAGTVSAGAGAGTSAGAIPFVPVVFVSGDDIEAGGSVAGTTVAAGAGYGAAVGPSFGGAGAGAGAGTNEDIDNDDEPEGTGAGAGCGYNTDDDEPVDCDSSVTP